MIDKEKQIKSKYYYRICAIFLSIIAIFSCIVPFSVNALNAYPYLDTYEDFQDKISNINPEEDFLFFSSWHNNSDSRAYVISLYACLENVPATVTDSSIEFVSDSGFEVYYGYIYSTTNNTSDWYYPGKVDGSNKFTCYKLVYDKLTENFIFYTRSSSSAPISPFIMSDYNKSDGTFYSVDNFYTNIEEFTEVEKLDIIFTPSFEGEVNRALEGDSNYTAKSFNFQVINNTDKNYQYALGIFPEYISVSPNTFSGAIVSATWVYMTQHYVVSKDLTQKDYWDYNSNYKSLSKSSMWHAVKSGGSDYGFLNYSQLPIEENVNYRVVCVAFPCSDEQSEGFLKATEIFYDPAYLEDLEDYYDYSNKIDINSGHVVCDQIFYIKDLSDVPYNPNDTFFDFQVPYQNYDDYQDSFYSYNDVVDSDGKVVSKGQNLWSDKNSYIHNKSGSSSSSNRVPVEVNADTSAFIQSSNGVLAFFSNVLTIFPPEITAIMIFGVSAIVFVVILKFIRG